MAAEHIEMTGAIVVGNKVHSRLHDNAPVTMRPHGILDRRDHLSVRQAERRYVRPGQETKPQLSSRPIRQMLAAGG
jgi:hypothetical protein